MIAPVVSAETAVMGVVAYVVAGSSSALVTSLAAVSPIIATVVGIYLASRIRQVHTLVNSQMTAALQRIGELETKLGLSAGEKIPTAAIVTEPGASAASPANKEVGRA